MHDYFHILGVSPDARAPEIRHACRRHARAAHPDVQDGAVAVRALDPDPAAEVTSPDAAVDFAIMAPIVRRMQTAFFADERPGRSRVSDAAAH